MVPLTVLTGVAVVTLGASAAAREPVAGAVVLARAVQAAAGPVLPWETFCWQDTDRKRQTTTTTKSLTSPRKALT